MSYSDTYLILTNIVSSNFDKFIFATKAPEFKSWFLGRMIGLYGNSVNLDYVESILTEMMK